MKKSSKVDYQLDVIVKVKTYHGNMLKNYVKLLEPVVHCLMSVVDAEQFDESDDECNQEAYFLEVQSRESFRDEDVNHVTGKTMDEFLCRYSGVLSDVPGHTHVLEHDIRNKTGKPFRVRPMEISLL